MIETYITSLNWEPPLRAQKFSDWLQSVSERFQLIPESIQTASADASFRRYFRIASQNEQHPSYIIMDAPPEQEESTPFVQIAQLMQDAGISAPEILNWDQTSGFLLITDLGQKTILETIQDDATLAPPLFKEAVDVLVRWQLASRPALLPEFNEAALLRELSLFPEWYLGVHRSFELNDERKNMLSTQFQLITQHNLSSPSVFVHRDYMPRNLMVSAMGSNAPQLGVIDFQDAVYGPITYDIASLMRDAFYSWDEEFVLDITIRYWEAARKAKLPVDADFSDFWTKVEWMGLQRHLKILGIFARLTLRDGKPKYLPDTPRFIHYVRATCSRYRTLTPLLRLIDEVEGTEPQYGYVMGR